MRIRDTLKFLYLISFLLGYLGPFGIIIDLGPFSLYPFRILFLFILFFLFIQWIVDNRLTVRFFENGIRYGWFFLLWMIYLVFASMWIVELSYAKRELFNLLIILLYILVSLYIVEDERDFKLLMRVWLGFYILNLIVGFWEVLTGNHLPTSKYHIAAFKMYKAEVSILYKKSFMPTTFFVNQNNFATYLSISIPLVFFYVRNVLLRYVLSFGGVFLLLATISRANLIAIFLEATVLPFFLNRRQNSIYIPAYVFSLILAALVVYSVATEALTIKDPRIERFYLVIKDKIVNFFKGGMGERELSTRIRIGLIENSLYYFEKTSGMGTGPGQLEYYIDKFPVAYTYYLKDPHNWWLEILAKYGIFIFVAYVLFLLYLMYNFFSMRRCSLAKGLIVALVGFIPASISPSGMMTFFPMWAFFIISLLYIKVTSKVGKCVF